MLEARLADVELRLEVSDFRQKPLDTPILRGLLRIDVVDHGSIFQVFASVRESQRVQTLVVVIRGRMNAAEQRRERVTAERTLENACVRVHVYRVKSKSWKPRKPTQ